jgi:hypothetical protein
MLSTVSRKTLEYWEDNEVDPLVHPLTDKDLYSYDMIIAIGEKAKGQLETLYEFFSILLDQNVLQLSDTDDAMILREFYYLLGNPADACFCFTAYRWVNITECVRKPGDEIEVIGLIHTPFAHAAPPFETWYPLLTTKWSPVTLIVLLDMLEESLVVLCDQLKCFRRREWPSTILLNH